MSFSPHIVQTRGAGDSGTGLSASLIKMRGGAAQLYLHLRLSVAKSFGWGEGDRLAVLMGEGEDHGLVRLRKAPDGTAVVTLRKTHGPLAHMRIALGRVPAFVDRSEKRKWCQFEVIDDDDLADRWVEVVLPSWADETGPGKRQRVAALPGARTLQLAPPVPKTDPGRLPGDPPPGRSALDQKRPAVGLAQSNGRDARPTRGGARRAAEAREAPDHATAEAEAWNRKADDDTRLALLCQTLGLTITEARLVKRLLDGKVHAREALHQAAYAAEPNGGPEIKILDVFLSKIRKKVATRLVEIETVRGIGWQMPAASVARVMVLIDDAAPGREDDEAELAALADAGDKEEDAA